jgi:hypothetical protein
MKRARRIQLGIAVRCYGGDMPEESAPAGAPLERPDRYAVLLVLQREVAADAARVFPVLVRQIAPADGYTKFAAYPDDFTAVMQGGWWYRGEYRVTPAPGGATVSYTVLNIAQQLHRGGGFASRSVVARSPSTFARHLDALEDSLRQE